VPLHGLFNFSNGPLQTARCRRELVKTIPAHLAIGDRETDMLQRAQLQPAVDFSAQLPAPPGGSEQGGVGEIVDFVLGFLLRQYLVIVLLVLLAGAAGATYLAYTPSTYTADAKLFIGTQKAQFIQQQSLFADTPIDNAQMESQIQILQSKGIIASVVRKLKLVDDPEFTSPRIGLMGRVVNFFTAILEPPKLDATELDATEIAIRTLTNRLAINRVGLSFVVEIIASAGSPEKAAQIANALATAYIDDQQEAKHEANRAASTWLQDRLQQLSEQSAAAEQAVVEFKQKNNIVAAAGKRLDEQNLEDLNTRLVAARTHTSDTLTRLNRIDYIIRHWDPNTTLDASASDELPSKILTDLRQQYLDLSRKEAEYSARYGRDHQAVVNLRNKMRELRASTFDEFRRIAETFKSEYEIAKQRQAEVEKQLDQVTSQSQTANKAQVTLRELESTAKNYHSLYETFLQRYTGAIQQDSLPLAEARMISLASPLTTDSKPNPLKIFTLSLVGGIGLGVGVGFLRDMMDRVFRTRAQVESLLQLPCIAMVPLLEASASTRSKRGQLPTKTAEERIVTRDDASVFWRVIDSPLSLFAESIRSIKLAANYYGTAPNRVIGFTSSLPNEGKSTIAAAVAQLTARAGGRAIIVDCDLRIRSLSRRLAPDATVGIVDVITGARSLEETVWRDPNTNLFFLPAAKQTPVFSSEVLESELTKRLIDTLRESFDFVIVDLPPLVPIVDARAAAHLVDCMFLVIEWGRTKIDVVKHALDTSPNLHHAIIGAVLNKTNMNRLAEYDVYYGNVYKDKYYTKYGYLHNN
jgi:exopolysaccharide transport family protein